MAIYTQSDAAGPAGRIKFVADDISKLPGTAPGAHNLMNILDKVRKLENQMRQMETTVGNNTTELMTQKKMMSGCEERLTGLESKDSYAAKVVNDLQAKSKHPVPSTSATGPAPGKAATQKAHVQGERPNMPNRQETLQRPEQKRSQAGVPETRGEDDTNQATNNSGWQTKWRRRPRPMVIGAKRNEQSAKVTAADDADIKVWNLSSLCEAEDIRAAVEAEGVVVKDVVMLSKPEWRTRSFKITIPVKDKQKVMSPEMWDEGIKIGHFYPERKPRNRPDDGN